MKLARLKKYLKTKKNYLVCKNEGCGAKYGTAQGFLIHQKICGVKEEEREKFVCDLCGKEYITMPGLTYHMNTKHAQVNGRLAQILKVVKKELRRRGMLDGCVALIILLLLYFFSFYKEMKL